MDKKLQALEVLRDGIKRYKSQPDELTKSTMQAALTIIIAEGGTDCPEFVEADRLITDELAKATR